MKIKCVTVLAFERQLDGRAFNPVFRWRERRARLLLIEATSGARGIGEAWSRYNDSESVLKALTAVAALVKGGEIIRPLDAAHGLVARHAVAAELWARAAAISALDMALWDAFGHEQGQPVWRLLGGNTDLAPVYASGGLYKDNGSVDDLAAEMRPDTTLWVDAVNRRPARHVPAPGRLQQRLDSRMPELRFRGDDGHGLAIQLRHAGDGAAGGVAPAVLPPALRWLQRRTCA